jgi:hypothetical protein
MVKPLKPMQAVILSQLVQTEPARQTPLRPMLVLLRTTRQQLVRLSLQLMLLMRMSPRQNPLLRTTPQQLTVRLSLLLLMRMIPSQHQ